MQLKRFYVLLFWIVCAFPVAAQQLPDIEKLLESNDIGNTADGYEEMVNTLLYLANAPLNINTADFDSLKMLFLLSDSQIDQLSIFRKKYGNFLHIRELLWVPGFSRKDFDNISPFITVGDIRRQERSVISKSRMKQEVLAKIRTSLPRQEGYKKYSPADFDKRKDYERKVENRFHGPPLGTLIKYKLQWGSHLQAGITLENDPGEGYFTPDQKAGFDFLSAYLAVNGQHFVQTLVIGDYRLQWGQGLVAWSGFASGKSDMVVGNEKSGRGISAYSSTDENNYLRGVALSACPYRNLTFDLFFSAKKTDGNLTPADTLAEEDFITVSLYESGYHRNNSECEKKHSLKEMTTGLALHWNSAYCKIGLNALYYDFKPALIPGDRLYQQYNDTGHKRWLASVDYKTAYRNIYLFGETALSDRGVWATIDGLRMSNSFMSGSVLYRRYDKKYMSRYAAGFGEYSNTSNEEGIYCGMDFTPLKNFKINIYYDWFRFFSPRYQASSPGEGWETLASLVYRHSKFEHAFRFKYESRPEDAKGVGTVARQKSEYRYQFNYRCHKQLEFRTRLSMSGYRKDRVDEKGCMIYQDVIATDRKADFKAQFRLAYFDTDSYQSRIYAYENNVLYGYSFPAFSGKGWRTYLNVNWKPLKCLTCYLKSGFIIYPGKEFISSGITQVKGNRQFDITFQLRLRI